MKTTATNIINANVSLFHMLSHFISQPIIMKILLRKAGAGDEVTFTWDRKIHIGITKS